MNRLEAARIRLGLKPAEVAKRLRISQQYASDIRLGKRRPGLQVALRIQQEFLIPVEVWAETPTAPDELSQAQAA